MFPQIDFARVAIYAVLFVAVVTLAELHGYSRGKQLLFEAQAEQAVQAVKVARAREIVTEKVVTKYVERQQKAQVVTNTITKEVVRYVESNPGSCLDARWRELHDAAAKNELPISESVAHAAGGAPTAAAAISTVTENYAACNRTADRLDALQDWVREQSKVDG